METTPRAAAKAAADHADQAAGQHTGGGARDTQGLQHHLLLWRRLHHAPQVVRADSQAGPEDKRHSEVAVPTANL